MYTEYLDDVEESGFQGVNALGQENLWNSVINIISIYLNKYFTHPCFFGQ